MEALARAAECFSPRCRVTHIENAHFDRFLFFDPAAGDIEASADVSITETGDLTAALLTRTRSSKAGITRTKTHAVVTFLQSETAAPFVPIDVAAAPEGVCYRIHAERLYRELVPFGPAYRNIRGELLLGADGALAEIVCPAPASVAAPPRLGSPFALDAAFHAACVWGQHHHRVTAFPMAVGERRVLLPTEPGGRYFARIIPIRTSPDLLVFDIWLFDQEGRLRETARNVEMCDPSSGRLKPPAWISGPATDPLADLRDGCDALAVVELSAVAPFASRALSPLELARFGKMGPRRKRSFLGARLALKRLFRYRRQETFRIPAEKIETVRADGTEPCCSGGDIAPLGPRIGSPRFPFRHSGVRTGSDGRGRGSHRGKGPSGSPALHVRKGAIASSRIPDDGRRSGGKNLVGEGGGFEGFRNASSRCLAPGGGPRPGRFRESLFHRRRKSIYCRPRNRG